MSRVINLFAAPIMHLSRPTKVCEAEEQEIKDIIEEGMIQNQFNSNTKDSYIFDTKLQEIYEFCSDSIDTYVKEIFNPKDDNDINYYITQSWVNVNKPKEAHHMHYHPNSIISGVFYIKVDSYDSICFHDPLSKLKSGFHFGLHEPKEMNDWNYGVYAEKVLSGDLVLFPSWLEHSVFPNKSYSEDRISVSFNTFVEGTIGDRKSLTQLNLKCGS
tara:strand:- start:768 stop:1412 length:645 start_codon:yes stop_codon:yes gene_type:complete